MVRSAQSAKKGHHYVWDTQLFLDHEGKQATRLRLVSSGAPDESIERVPVPVFAFQIYSTLPLEGDLCNLVKYFGGEYISHEYSHPTWEIYDTQADAFACVDHRRREIAHRKHVSQTHTSSSPLIPKIVRDPFSDHRRHGFILLVDSNRDCDGFTRSLLFDPSGPLWVHFDRKFPQKSTVDNMSRLEVEPRIAKSVGESVEDIVILPEKLEMVAKRIQNTSIMANYLEGMIRMSTHADGSLDYGLDEDEGQPPYGIETAGALFQNFQELLLQDLQCSSGPGGAMTVASKDCSPEPDLRYIIYVPFLNSASTSTTTIESVAKAFASSIISHLPEGRTIYFEFHKPQFPSLANIVFLHRAQLANRPNFTIGALHTIDGQRNRFYPCTRNQDLPFYPAIERYETFIVVLDKPKFLEEQGVLFVMTDGGRLKSLFDDEGHMVLKGSESDYDETVVLRSAGMEEVARRLGMVVLTKNQPER